MKSLHAAFVFPAAVLCLAASLPCRAAESGPAPPWKGQYKIKPTETGRLTEADVVGPDGVVYPNWTKTGVQGGIPRVAVAATIEHSGGRADDGNDDSAALERACRAVGEKGGGAVLLGEGVYHLDRPVAVRPHPGGIRRPGAAKTRLVFRYALPESGIAFPGLEPGSRIGRNSQIDLHCRPARLATMTIEVDGQMVHQWTRGEHSGNTFATSVTGRAIVGRVRDGRHTLCGTARYQDGTTLRTEIPVRVDSTYSDPRPAADFRAAIVFAGQGYSGPPVQLARDGRRGERTLTLEGGAGLAPGDRIHIEAPATKRWNALVQNACKWGRYRQYQLQVEKVEGNKVTVSQPLRIDFPTIDGSFVRKIVPIQGCGVEDLSIEQTENLWITSVLFSNAWNCWARGVTVKKCGRFPVYGSNAKWCEIRDCVFDDAWFKGGGGTAYAGWDGCCDCLMENVETFKLRHAPLFQWAASGNVIRKSVFHESDAQWHAGWTHENLIEQCVVESAVGHGGYGFGMWASPPEDTAHGPNGPRNVVYHCDIRSPKTGLWMGGMNENWLILYNRFRVEKGSGVSAKTASFDHILRGNVFVLADPKASMVHLATADCIGLEILDNALYGGNGQFATGKARPAVLAGNRALPLADAPWPTPAVPSIYEWQRSR
jgi:hypothetical protein